MRGDLTIDKKDNIVEWTLRTEVSIPGMDKISVEKLSH